MSLLNVFRPNQSGSIAKDRLKVVLFSDRATCSGDLVERMRRDIINVMSKYIDIDETALDIEIKHTSVEETGDKVPSLQASIPIRNLKVK